MSLENEDIINNILKQLDMVSLDSLIKIKSLLYTGFPYNCVHTALKNNYVIVDHIGKGFNGDVFAACKGHDCEYALKTMNNYNNHTITEGKFSKIAGHLGIGPKVYQY